MIVAEKSSVTLVQGSPGAGRRTCVLLCHGDANADGRLPSLCISQFCMSQGETKENPGAALGAVNWFSVTCPEDLSSLLYCKGRWK